MLRFDWDDRKADVNLRKHGIQFAEAQTVFDDPLARIHLDPNHSKVESRELLVGHSIAGRLLLIGFIEANETIRIISAREANRKERKRYEERPGKSPR